LLALLNDIVGSPFGLVARWSRFRRLGSGRDLETLLFNFLTKDPITSRGRRRVFPALRRINE